VIKFARPKSACDIITLNTVYVFACCQIANFHKSHTLGYTNGYAIQKRPAVGPGGVPLSYNQLSEQDLDELANYNPTLTYGQAKQAPPEEFVPAYVAFDKKVRTVFLLHEAMHSINYAVTRGQSAGLPISYTPILVLTL